jgi:hypothetical protein
MIAVCCVLSEPEDCPELVADGESEVRLVELVVMMDGELAVKAGIGEVVTVFSI